VACLPEGITYASSIKPFAPGILMRRRDLLFMFGGALVASPRLLADSSIVSTNPLITEYGLESTQGRYTPVAEFYVRSHFAAPATPAMPQLRITGEVERPQTLTSQDLAHLPQRRLGAVLECSGSSVGPYQLVSNAIWEGWPLSNVLALARPKPSAVFLHLYGRDGFVRSVPIERATGDAMIATRMNGEPLSLNHGAPWRVFLPGWYGMDSVKWLQRIDVATSAIQPVPNEYWAVERAPDGKIRRVALPEIQLKSVFIYPALGAVVKRGTVDVRGLAWSSGGVLAAVEVSTDGGKVWRLAEIDPLPNLSPYEWKFWRATIDLTEPGLVELACKAIGANGKEQPAARPANRIDGYANNVIERIRIMVI
jgi:DMSO/TMAO reductase YedYZ molybdopterin-dependent catalytic subunit